MPTEHSSSERENNFFDEEEDYQDNREDVRLFRVNAMVFDSNEDLSESVTDKNDKVISEGLLFLREPKNDNFLFECSDGKFKRYKYKKRRPQVQKN